MKLQKALEILSDYVKLDREIRRDDKELSEEVQMYCEEKCRAIEKVCTHILLHKGLMEDKEK